ncbi:MAG: SDR family NAD(P)-dependent oxidoreductase [Coriobacteriales bacterium]
MGTSMDFNGKVAIVTGARSGIGKATAIALGAAGAKVVCAGRRACDETVAQIVEAGGQAITVCCDVSQEADVIKLVEKTVKEYGKLDVAVNAAGMNIPAIDLVDQTAENFDKIMAVDVRGVFLCMKYEAIEMLKAGGGSIVNIASVAGLIADPGMAPYVGAKHAVVGMTKGAGIELAAKGVRVNCVCPGLTNSEMTAFLQENQEAYDALTSMNFQRRVAEADEVACACLFLASDLSSFMNGSVITVDGGQTAH